MKPIVIKGGKFTEFFESINYVMKFRLLLLIPILIFVFLLSYLSDSRLEFISALGRIALMLGILIIAPYLIIKIYLLFSSTDTSFILEGLGTGMVNPKELFGRMVRVLVPLMLLDMFSKYAIMLGFVLVFVGVYIKLYITKEDLQGE